MTDIGRLLETYRTVRYLDAVRSLPSVVAAKARILELLALRPGQRALDVGCGTGEDVWSLAERVGAVGRAEGVDANPWMVGEARRRAQAGARDLPIAFRVGDIYGLPYRDASFDAVRAERVFIHLVEPLRAIRELVRVTRPGGTVLAADASLETLSLAGPTLPLTERIVRQITASFPDGRVGSRLRELFGEAGLESIEVEVVEHVVRTVTESETLFSIGQTTSQLVANGLATAAEVADWRSALARLEQRGDLAWSITGYIVRGRAPGPKAST